MSTASLLPAEKSRDRRDHMTWLQRRAGSPTQRSGSMIRDQYDRLASERFKECCASQRESR